MHRYQLEDSANTVIVSDSAESLARDVRIVNTWMENLPMLVLSRKLHERLFIGSDVVIEVLEITRTKVRIGIHAFTDIPIVREEAIAKTAAKRKAAGQGTQGCDG